ncbi:hypothetical protein C8J57DRAFT_1240377 [Mycena rebaudengoi]|nr:hypothetical protein C8J57DRAFT_1240377 [Mycena rebaudengoi]
MCTWMLVYDRRLVEMNETVNERGFSHKMPTETNIHSRYNARPQVANKHACQKKSVRCDVRALLQTAAGFALTVYIIRIQCCCTAPGDGTHAYGNGAGMEVEAEWKCTTRGWWNGRATDRLDGDSGARMRRRDLDGFQSCYVGWADGDATAGERRKKRMTRRELCAMTLWWATGEVEGGVKGSSEMGAVRYSPDRLPRIRASDRMHNSCPAWMSHFTCVDYSIEAFVGRARCSGARRMGLGRRGATGRGHLEGRREPVRGRRGSKKVQHWLELGTWKQSWKGAILAKTDHSPN